MPLKLQGRLWGLLYFRWVNIWCLALMNPTNQGVLIWTFCILHGWHEKKLSVCQYDLVSLISMSVWSSWQVKYSTMICKKWNFMFQISPSGGFIYASDWKENLSVIRAFICILFPWLMHRCWGRMHCHFVMQEIYPITNEFNRTS